MAGLLRRKSQGDAGDVALAEQLDERLQRARDAERALAQAEAAGLLVEEVRALRRALDHAFTEALEAADAAYRVAVGPIEGLARVKYLARLTRPEVGAADRRRREIALARTHYRVAARDDLWTTRLGVVPPSVGTHADVLGSHEGH